MTPLALVIIGVAALAGGVLVLYRAFRLAARWHAPMPIESDWDERYCTAPAGRALPSAPASHARKGSSRIQAAVRTRRMARPGRRTSSGVRPR